MPVGGRACDALSAYVESGRPHFVKPATGSELFLSARGGALSRVRLWMLVKMYAQAARASQSPSSPTSCGTPSRPTF